MSDFKPVVVEKDGRDDRLALTPTQLVQFEHDGWSVKRDAPAKLVTRLNGGEQPKADDSPSSS